MHPNTSWLKSVLKKIYFGLVDVFLFLALIGRNSRIFAKNVLVLTSKSKAAISMIRIWQLQLKLKLFGRPTRIIKVSTVVMFLLSIATTAVVAYQVFENLPSPKELMQRKVPASTKIYDRNGNLLYKIYRDENRTPVKLSGIPQITRDATLAVEDAEFYKHNGFSPKAIVRAFIKNIKEGRLTGGSTITQQLVKNTLLSPEKTVLRKLKEIALSIQVETTYSKDEILEMYLNEVSYGNSAYGIQEAAQTYFGKDVGQLDIAESALLAGLPKSPTFYSPFGSDPSKAKDRQMQVLALMHEKGFINQKQLSLAQSEKLVFVPNRIDIKAPHFVMYVREWLVQKYGEEVVEKGGLEVTTTLDLSIQDLAQEVVSSEVDKLKALNVTNGDALVISPNNGQILAMVGSKNYFDNSADGNVNVVLRPRSPGSSIKPITYSYALENGFTPATIIPDTPFTIKLEGHDPYTPKNYDSKFRGPITLRSALAESRNIPAVRIINELGVKNVMDHGRKMGINSWQDISRYGPSLTLGGGEVTLLDLAQAYTAFPNMGAKIPLNPVLDIKDYKNKIYYHASCTDFSIEKCPTEQVLDPRVAFQIIDILRDNNARTPAFGSNSMLVIRDHPEVAVKTGTSNDLRDNLTVGFSQDYLTAIWVGNNDNSPMSRVASGVTGASPIWNKIMSALLADKQSKEWQPPQGLVQKQCLGKNEWFLEENISECRFPSPTPGSTDNHITP